MKSIMNKFVLILLSFLLIQTLKAQDSKNNMVMMSHAISADVLVPVQPFNETHRFGLGVFYNWYGKQLNRKPDQSFTFSFAATGGVSLYAGKSYRIGSDFIQYPKFILINAYGGISARPWKLFNFTLTGGPALGIYNGSTRFNLGAKLSGHMMLSNIAVGPSIQLMKESKSDPLWAGSLGIYIYL